VRRSQRDICIVATVFLVVFLVLALTAVTTAKPPLREVEIKSEHFDIPKHPDLQNLSIGYAVSAEATGDQLKAQSWPLVENRGVARSTNDNEGGSPLGWPGIALGSGYLNLSGNFSTLWHQSMMANATNADLIFDVDGDNNPDVMVVTTAYDPDTDVETKKLIIKKGTNGTHLWEQAVSAKGRGNCSISIDWFVDLDGDNLDDAFVLETERNASTGVEETKLIAKRGYDGTHLWNQTVTGTECGIVAEWVRNLDEDALDEVIVYERSYDAATDVETKKVIAKDGNTGTHLWEQTVTADGYQNCNIGVEWITDLDGDGLDDVLVRIRKYNVSDDTESITIRALKGKDGTTLWEEMLRETEVFMWLNMRDLDDDDVDDVLVEEWTYNESTNLTTGHILAKKGSDGTHLWTQSVNASGYDNCAIWFDGFADLNGDNVTDVFISEYNYNESTDISTSKVVAKHGLNGTHLWEQSVQAAGRSTCIKFVRWITDLNGDDLDDVMVFEQLVNVSTDTESTKMIAKRGFDGTHLWEQIVNGTESDIWVDLADDLDGDNLPDVIVREWSYNESTDMETLTVLAKKGTDGTHLWEQSVNGTECGAGIPFTSDLDGDGLDDVLVYERTYNESLDLDTTQLIAKKGTNGTHLWEQSVTANGWYTTDIWPVWSFDIDGDGLDDIVVIELAVNISSQTATFNVIAKKGIDGTHFWEQSVSGTDIGLWMDSGFDLNGDAKIDFIIGRGSYTESINTTSVILTAKRGYDGTHFWEQSVSESGQVNCDLWVDRIVDLDGDALDDAIVWEWAYNESTNKTSVILTAKRGYNGAPFWEQSVNGSGRWSCDIWVETLADLDDDGLDDAVVIERAYNELANATLERLIAKRGYDGVHLFEAVSDEPIWTTGWWEAYNLDGVGLNDLLFGISTEMYAVTYRVVLAEINVTPATKELEVDETQEFTATAKNQDGEAIAGVVITWTSSNTAVGDVSPSLSMTDANGAAKTTFTAKAEGIATVKAENATVNGTAQVTVKKKYVPFKHGGGGYPKDTDDDGYSDVEELIAGTDPDDATDYPGKPVATPAPTPTLTATPTPSQTPTVPMPTPTATPKPAATTTPPPKEPGFEAIFAIAGLLAIVYLMLHRKQ
jgi:hypothetical protein